MSVNPRMSGFWSVASGSSGMNYYRVDGDGEEEEDALVRGAGDEELGGAYDGRTPLDRTIDRIGMGSYQWTLLSLCGFGWLADNMWIQAIAIILPRVQRHFDVPDSYIGTLSSSMFAGMMFGAVGWGTCSDLMGRTTAFNATLFLTSVFGVVAALANTFTTLCISLFLLGSAVGGSMPTDGTLLLEHMPNGKQYLVTALSVFFSVGSVVAAFIGLLVIPPRSCPPLPAPCDVAAQNMGWKYLLASLGLITLLMFCARMIFFRLHESPRYLVHAGRHREAIESLQMISKFNGSELSLDIEDVQDVPHPPSGGSSPAKGSPPQRGLASPPHDVLFDADGGSPSKAVASDASREPLRNSSEETTPDYSSTGGPNVVLSEHTFRTPSLPGTPFDDGADSGADPPSPSEVEDHIKRGRRSSSRGSRRTPPLREPSRSSLYEVKSKLYWKLPRVIRKPLWAWTDRIAMVLSPEWVRTTLFVWGTWWSMSLAYTMFNVYLPKLLEGRGRADDGSSTKTLSDNLWDVVIYAVGGCPGAIIGAWLVDSRLGRKWSLAWSTILTALFCVFFIYAERAWAVRLSTVGISLSATAMWAVLYGWTPEIFDTRVRGTACGIASALSRIGGMIAPMLGGALLVIDISFPVFGSIAIFLLAVVCILFLREDDGARGSHAGLMH